MSRARRYAVVAVMPPLLFALPVAGAFLARVTSLSFRQLAVALLCGAGAYLIGAAAASVAIARAFLKVERETEARRDPSSAVSNALAETTLWGSLLWIGWGMLIAMVGCALLEPTIFGVQYFGEAAMIVAAPAMAWGYWGGKRMLMKLTDGAGSIEYTGRIWSIGVKIAIVFIGFFIVSVGGLVLVITSRVAAQIGAEAAQQIARFGVMMAGGTALVFAVATWFLAKDISGPTTELVRLAGDMAAGRFSADVRVFSDDEIGAIGRSFGLMKRDLQALVGRVGDRGESITSGVRTMTIGTDSLVDNVHEQSGMAVDASSALSVVQGEAESVLVETERVAQLTVDSTSRAGELRASFVEVARRMDDLFRSVEKSSSAAAEIDASARETAGRTTTLAAIGADVLAFVAQMDATVEQITRTAQATADLSEQVRENAVAGRTAVEATMEGIRNTQDATRRTTGAFDSLQKSLGRIDEILLFIDEVTNRTNLLSFNAAIIAAQAGRNDYGFSVIADEVRQLADRTRTATKEIAAIIRGVQPVARQAVGALEEGVRNVDQTVELATNASHSLETILGSAVRSLEMTRSISHALQEQAKASRHLHDEAARMSDNLEEMHRATEGQATATRMLAREAEQVSDIALQVKRATEEQKRSGEGIARAMEQIASDVRTIRDRLDRQLHQAEQIAGASRLTLSIAERNSNIAEQFRSSLQALLRSGQEFEAEVTRFRG